MIKMVKGKRKLVGKVAHFYSRIGVAIIEMSDTVMKGDKISIEGATTNLQQTIKSMEIEHKVVTKAVRGESIGLKVGDRCRKGDNVYKILEK